MPSAFSSRRHLYLWTWSVSVTGPSIGRAFSTSTLLQEKKYLFSKRGCKTFIKVQKQPDKFIEETSSRGSHWHRHQPQIQAAPQPPVLEAGKALKNSIPTFLLFFCPSLSAQCWPLLETFILTGYSCFCVSCLKTKTNLPLPPYH